MTINLHVWGKPPTTESGLPDLWRGTNCSQSRRESTESQGLSISKKNSCVPCLPHSMSSFLSFSMLRTVLLCFIFLLSCKISGLEDEIIDWQWDRIYLCV